MASRKLEVIIAGDARGLTGALGDASGGLDSFGAKLGGLGKIAAVGFAAVSAAAVGAGAALFAIDEVVGGALDSIRFGTGETGEALAGLEQSFRNVAVSAPASLDDAAAAITGLQSRMGLTGKPLEDLSVQFLNLARVTGGDVATSIETMTRTFGDWSITDQTGALDMMFRASQATGVSVEQLGATVTTFGGPLRQLGFSFEESTALIGKFEKEGVNTELVLGSMRQSLGRMARAGEDPIETFRRVTEEIQNAGTAGEANGMALELFGARAGPDMAAAIREGRFEIGDLLATITDGTDTINEASNSTIGFSEQWTMIKNRVMVGLQPIATKVFDAIGNAMAALVPIVERVVAVFREDGLGGVFRFVGDAFERAWPSIRATLGDLAEAFVGWVKDVTPPLLRALGDMVQRVGRWLLDTGLPAMRDKLKMWTEAFFAWVAVALPPALQELGRMVGAFGTWLLDEGLPLLVEKLKVWGAAFAEWVGPVIGPLLVELGKLALKLLEWVATDALPKLVVKLAEWAGAFAGWVAREAIPKLLVELGKLGLRLLDWVGGEAVKLGARLGSWVTELIGWPARAAFQLAANLESLAGGILGWVGGLPARIATAARGMWNGISDAFRGALNNIIRWWNDLEFKLPSFAGLSVAGRTVIPGWEGPTLDTPNIPTFHAGGTFRAPNAGGEGTAILRDGEVVRSASQDPGGGMMVVLQVDGREFGRVAVDALRAHARSTGPITLPIRVGAL